MYGGTDIYFFSIVKKISVFMNIHIYSAQHAISNGSCLLISLKLECKLNMLTRCFNKILYGIFIYILKSY